jgi:hypothetical protein
MRQYGPGHPLVFGHIPKTAGTSLTASLRAALAPETFVRGVDFALVGGYDDVTTVRPAIRASLVLAPEELAADATLVAGHLAPATTLARYPGADHITVLRAPQNRLLSQWVHSRSLTEFDLRAWGTMAEAMRLGRLPLRQYLRAAMIAPNVDNTITRFLVWPHPLTPRDAFIDPSHDDELYGAALERLGSYGYVNVIENKSFVADLAAWLGRDLPTVQLNERTSVPPRWRPDLSSELDERTRELLDDRCRIDVRIWTHVVERVLPDRDPGQLLNSAVTSLAERYEVMRTKPYDRALSRRIVERGYDVLVKLRSRRA